MLSVTFVACDNAKQQAPAMAQDFCNCFSPVTTNLSPEAKNLIVKASDSPNNQQAMLDELNKLNDEQKNKVSQELLVFREMQNPNSTVNNCIKGVEDKYKNAYTTDKEGFMKKIIDELEDKKGCEVTASLMKFGLAASRTTQ